MTPFSTSICIFAIEDHEKRDDFKDKNVFFSSLSAFTVPLKQSWSAGRLQCFDAHGKVYPVHPGAGMVIRLRYDQYRIHNFLKLETSSYALGLQSWKRPMIILELNIVLLLVKQLRTKVTRREPSNSKVRFVHVVYLRELFYAIAHRSLSDVHSKWIKSAKDQSSLDNNKCCLSI